jgi:hypothetical protein
MNGSAGMRLVGLLICLGPVVLLQTATGAETYVTRTNWVENAITNVVEVRMPKNVFVNEYHTNWIDHVRTNVVTKELPRQVVVDFVHTNVITHYSTNYFNKSEERTLYIDLMSTNFVNHYRTNVRVLQLTNEIAVNLVRTNFVDRYRTNWQTLNFTNFQTVFVMQTNWITLPVTNLVRIDMPAQPALSAPSEIAKPVAAAKPQREVAKSATASPSDGPVLEGAKTSSRSDNNFVEVVLRVRWPEETANVPTVQQWKVEGEDGAFMTFGKEQTFKRELPVGSYKIEVRLKSDSPVAVLRGTLVVNSNEVVVRQKPAAKKLVSVNN